MPNDDQWRKFEPVSRLIIFPGDISEYEKLVGYKVEMINIDSRQKGVTVIEGGKIGICGIIGKQGHHLVYEGIEAIVHATIVEKINFDMDKSIYEGALGYYGLPVRKKK